jgi:hypothetical protein
MRNIGINELERKNDAPSITIILWAILMLTFMILVLSLGNWDIKPTKLDCSIAEFHPDYSAQQKQQCRALRKAAK